MQAQARARIQALVNQYQALSPAERRHLSETATRTNFIDPLFAALGWNMQDDAEVAREAAGGQGRRVDYAFKIKGVTRFLLEAKKLSAELTDPQYVRQAADYAWNRGIDWIVLTNFHELKLYYASQQLGRLEPVFALGHEDFLRQLPELCLLSKPAQQENQLQTRVVGIPRRQAVDQQLFADLAKWRHDLLTNIRQFHPAWSNAQGDEAAQRILNRLIFIRSIEDKRIEERALEPLLRQLEGQNHLQHLPAALTDLYRRLDRVYNAELFAQHFCENYQGPAEPLVDMVRGLHQRLDQTRYDFAAIGVDILGTVYEQYLTAAQAERARKKLQGIHYTPRFVVRYITRNTLGKALAAAHARGGIQAARQIRVLDPACGSGSFLIAAFDELNDWLRQNDPTLQDDAQRYQHILRENLFGVDLDAQAVAVTRLNLWLRAVERREKLPEIPNIRHGDSLLDAQFDWEREFAKVCASGGFDVVVGNPPYVRQEALTAQFKEYARRRYRCYHGRADLYVYFYERAHELLRADGYFGFISSNKFMRANYGKKLRDYLLETAHLEEIVDLSGLPVFKDVAVDSAIVITQKADSRPEKQEFLYTAVQELPAADLAAAVNARGIILDERSLQFESWPLAPMEDMEILLRMRRVGIPLMDYLHSDVKIAYGTKTGYNDAYIISKNTRDRILRQNPQSEPHIRPLLAGKDIRKYRVDFQERYLITLPKGSTVAQMLGSGPISGGGLEPHARGRHRPQRMLHHRPEHTRPHPPAQPAERAAHPPPAGGQGHPQISRGISGASPDRHPQGLDDDADSTAYPPPNFSEDEAWAWFQDAHPALAEHLAQFEEAARKRRNQGDFWWELSPRREFFAKLEQPKIIYPIIASGSRFTYDTLGYYLNDKAFFIPLEDYYLIGVLNSNLLWFYGKKNLPTLGDAEKGGGLEWRGTYVKRLPIVPAAVEDPRRQAIEAAVGEALTLAPRRAAALPGSQEGLDLDRRLAQLDDEIDEAVFTLYGLTPEQCARVRGE